MARLDSGGLGELRSAVADLLDKRSSESHVRALMDTATAHDPDLWRELAEMGLIGLLVPEEYGGSGGGHVAMGVVMEEMGAALMCGPFFASAILTTNALQCAGDTAEMSSVLPRLASGESIGTVAFAEDDSGVGALPAAASTQARQATDGAWRVAGSKTYVLDAAVADLIYVLADSDSGRSIFAVDAGAPGLTVSTLTTIDRTRKQYRVSFTDTPARLVGRPGDGMRVLGDAVELSAVALISEQAGGTHRAMRMAVDYAKARYQFGRAIGSFQAVKHMCADMLLEAESAISAARHVADLFDSGAPPGVADLPLAQAYCADAFVDVAAATIQVHGGIGFTWEHPAHLYLRRARTDAHLLGDANTHRETYLRRVEADRNGDTDGQ